MTRVDVMRAGGRAEEKPPGSGRRGTRGVRGARARRDPGGATQTLDRVEELVRQLRRMVGPVRPEAWLEVDLTITQLKALYLLDARQPLTLGAVADALGVSLASASALVDRLVRLDLVERRDDPRDRRQLRLQVAPEGAALLARMEDRSISRLRTALARMSARGVAALETALEDLAEALANDEQPPEART